mmetsp:Transcript_23270/g.65932  ORF Transcript_23270/g.65932 Transcript_23270/m.65932 type:complete len:335 (+) Transcript_23270:396-1400(+)
MIRVYVLEDFDEDRVRYLVDVDDGCSRFLHISKEQRTKVLASQQHHFVSVHRNVTHHERDVGQRFAVNHVAEIMHERRLRHIEGHVMRGKVEPDEIVEAIRSIVTAENVKGFIVHACDMAETLAWLVRSRCLDLPPSCTRVGILRYELQLMKIIQRTSAGPSKDVHAVAVHCTHMRISRRWNRSIRCQLRPCAGVEIEHMRIGQMSGAIMSSVQQQRVLVNHCCGTISCSWASAGRGDRAPSRLQKIEFVQIRLVRPIVTTEYVKRVAVDHSRMRMSRRRWSSRLNRHLPPSHGREIEPPKVIDSRFAIKSTVHVHGIPVCHRHMTISWTGLAG